MSRHHPNVTWQSADGTWACGFHPFDYYTHDADDEDFDEEWSAEFDHSAFEWVSAGHSTPHEAEAQWDGANPGSSTQYSYDADDPSSVKQAQEFDMMAAELEMAEARREAELRRTNPRYGWSSFSHRAYNGPSKASQPAVLNHMLDTFDEQIVDTDVAQLGYQIQGYANDLTRQAGDLLAKRSELLARMQKAGVDTRENERAETQERKRLAGLRKLADDDLERRRRSSSGYRYGGYRPVQPGVTAARQKLTEEIARAEAEVAAIEKVKAARDAKKPPAKKATARKVAAKTAATGTRDRVQRGVPTGGQFAPRQHAESDVTLTVADL